MKKFLRKWKKYFVCAAVLSCLINFLQLTFSFYMFAIYDTIVASYSDSSLYTITIVALYALVHLAFFSTLRSKLLRTAGNDLDHTLGTSVLHQIIKGNSGPVKRTYQQGNADLALLRNYFNNHGLYALFDVPFTPFYLILIFFFHTGLGFLALGGCILAVALSILQDRLTRSHLVVASAANNHNRRFVDTMLRNAEAVNAMGMAENVYTRFDAGNRTMVFNQTVASRFAGITQSALKGIQSSMNVLIYGLGAYYVLTEGFDPGIMIAASMIMGQALSPLILAIYSAKSTVQAGEAYKRLSAFSAFIDARPEKMVLPAPRGEIEAEHLSFAFGRQIVLHDISFTLEPGDFLGLIGLNGAGKTTLSRILLGIWPPAMGSLRLDGVDMYAWDQNELGNYIGYLPQEIELFPGTIAENIARLGAVDEEIVLRAARAANIEAFIQGLPNGFDTRIDGKDGIVLSGGEKQRVGLARALYNEPTLLILDEPTSNLDEETEQHLIRMLLRLRSEKTTTCVVITHQMSLLQVASKVLILQNGQVAMFGPKDVVLEKIARAKRAARDQGKTG
ncbi:type I secretion system permease/ATPase [Desulforhopalus vacuolatus]|uniref:type I secretion system permease/ATPase n=1 Tax=Desulforhopalus vacuolatus TaxID=40414 RepID=UPI0019635A52|nr:type I secretion system permease/ATPase [Desulforhopalus vacuolatus]MBM9521120.1 type I secretion system permease/ATPase [Desulforhopalus vacuolatus]